MQKYSNNLSVNKFFEKLQVKLSGSQTEFDNLIQSKYGKREFKELDKLMKKHSRNSDLHGFYGLKNKSLSMYLDFLTISADEIRKFLNWCESTDICSPKEILDIGCEGGFVSCYFAERYPDAKIIGIDKNPVNIRIAQELATQLDLKNIRFSVGDLMCDFPMTVKYDIIITNRVIHEICNIDLPETCWSYSELNFKESAAAVLDKFIGEISNSLSDEGVYLNCERFATIDVTYLWVKKLLEHNIFPEWEKSCYLEYLDRGDPESAPAILTKKKPNSNSTDMGMIKLIEKKFRGLEVMNFEYSQMSAEFAFNELSDKHLVRGYEIVFDDKSGKMKVEVWATEEGLSIYVRSNKGFRSIKMFEKSKINEANNQLNMLVDKYRLHAEIIEYHG